MKKTQTLSQLLADASDQTLLFLGRESLFSHEEIARFLKPYTIKMTTTLDPDIVGCIESKRLNPVEEDLSNDVYALAVPTFTLDEFEQLISLHINEDELLMVVKLSNDQERIFRLLSNPYLPESLFVKLLMLYRWKEEEEDNKEDRDVIMFTLKRYIDIKPNEADLLYSYLTLRRLATEATNPKLLLALLGFQDFIFLVRGKEKVSLRETIAKNRKIDQEVIHKLMSLRDPKVNRALAANPLSGLSLLKSFLDKDETALNEGLASNSGIDNTLFEALLSKEERVVQLLLLHQKIDLERYAWIERVGLSEEMIATMGANAYLSEEVVERLLLCDSALLLQHLAQNEQLSQSAIEVLYTQQKPDILLCLASNPQATVEMLTTLYEAYDTLEMHKALAHNSKTSESCLRELYEKGEFEIHQSMASNASVPLDILDLLKIDSRLQNELSKNAILVKAYEVVLDYDKKAVQF